MGGDGILYRLVDQRDYQKYRTLSDEQIAEEMRRSNLVKENMYTLKGQLKDGKYTSKSKSGTRFVAPQFGTASRKNKIAKRTWDQTVASSTGKSAANPNFSASAEQNATIQKLLSNTSIEHEEYAEQEKPTFRPPRGGFDVSQSTGDRLGAAVNTMKIKYEQNLDVVEKLFEEKQQMSNYIQTLEQQLRASRYEDPSNFAHTYDELATTAMPPTGLHEGGSHSTMTPPNYEDVLAMKQSEFEPSVGRSRNGFNAREIAGQFDFSSSMPDTAMSGRGRSGTREGTQLRSSSASAANRRASTGHLERRNRSNSATRPRVSASLQADMDRYIQKRRQLEDKERLQKLEDEKYALTLRERNVQAAILGKEFSHMKKRQEEAAEMKKAKTERILREKQDVERKLIQEKKEKMRANQLSMTMVTRNQLSWKEAKEIEDAKRRDRVKARQHELAMSSALPSGIAESMSKPKRAPRDENSQPMNEFKAEDPAKVAAKLARQRMAWDIKVQQEKERQQQKKNAKQQLRSSASLAGNSINASMSLGGLSGDMLDNRTSMEKRQEYYAARRATRLKEKQAKEELEKKRKADEEQAKRDRLLKMRLPTAKPTKALERSSSKVMADLKREEDEARKFHQKQMKKELSSKETSRALQSIINEREFVRHGGTGTSYVELQSTRTPEQMNQAAAAAAAEAREEYRRKLRENKAQIKEKMRNRPTLMERHDLELAKKNAGINALKQVGGAVMADDDDDLYGSTTKTAKVEKSDVFNEREKMILGLDSP